MTRKIFSLFNISLLICLVMWLPTWTLQAQDTVYELPAIHDGDSMTDRFEDTITSRLYAFYGSAGDVIQISMVQNDNALDPILILMNSDGTLIAYDDDSGAVNLSALLDEIELETDGIYFVMATSRDYVDGYKVSTDQPLDYTIQFEGQSTPDSVTDDRVILVEDLPVLVDAVNGESAADSPLAFFVFDAREGDIVTLDLQSPDFLTVLHVVAPDGSRIAVDPSYSTLEIQEDGVYLVIATEQFFYQAYDSDNTLEGGTFSLSLER